MTAAILGTDMAEHFEFLSKFRQAMSTRPNGLSRDDQVRSVL
jgi:hypothetical protein